MDYPELDTALKALAFADANIKQVKRCVIIGDPQETPGGVISMSLETADHPGVSAAEMQEFLTEIRTTGKINGEPCQIAYMVVCKPVVPDGTPNLV